MKKILTFLLAVMMLSTMLSGCGKTDNVVFDEDINTVPETPYEIQWYLMADPQNDVSSVEEKINDYLKDKINATVKINCLSSAQYTQKLGTMINANEYFDLCFAARWALDYVGNSRAGAFIKLDDYLDTYLKDIADIYGRENLEYAKIDGGLYALPVYKEMVGNNGWIYRKDLAEKYNIDMTQYASFEAIEPVLKLIKENEPDIKYPLDWVADMTPAAVDQIQKMVSDTFIFREGTGYDGKSYNYYETEDFKKGCLLAKDYYDKGYVRPDIMTATDHVQRMKDGKTFVMVEALKPGKVEELFKDSAFEFGQVEITPPTPDYLAGTGSMQAISASSKNPARVMRFLNLLNTDAYLKNLVLYGVEGKHYTKLDEKTIRPIVGSGYDLSAYSWAIGNVFLDYTAEGEDPDKAQKLKEFNERAIKTELDDAVFTFVPKEDPERQRLHSEVKKTASKYVKQLRLGVVDVEEGIKQLNDELKKVGIDELTASYQAEFDEYLKSRK